MKKYELISLISEAILVAIDEATYPEGFNVQEFKDLPTFKARMNYVKARLPKIAQGSARAVFTVDDNTVLKVAMNQKGLAQNRVEADVGRQDKYPVAKVFEVGNDYEWIEMEKADKVNIKIFDKLAGVSFRAFQRFFWTYNAIEKPSVGYSVIKPPNYNEFMAGSNKLIYDTISMISDYDMPTGDLQRISSWGVVNRKGEQKLVLVDFGLTNAVWKDYYR